MGSDCVSIDALIKRDQIHQLTTRRASDPAAWKAEEVCSFEKCKMRQNGAVTHISHSMTPKAYTSTAWDTVPSVSSSGGMCVTYTHMWPGSHAGKTLDVAAPTRKVRLPLRMMHWCRGSQLAIQAACCPRHPASKIVIRKQKVLTVPKVFVLMEVSVPITRLSPKSDTCVRQRRSKSGVAGHAARTGSHPT